MSLGVRLSTAASGPRVLLTRRLPAVQHFLEIHGLVVDTWESDATMMPPAGIGAREAALRVRHLCRVSRLAIGRVLYLYLYLYFRDLSKAACAIDLLGDTPRRRRRRRRRCRPACTAERLDLHS